MTSHRSEYKQALRAMFTHDHDKFNAILAAHGDGDWNDTGKLILAVFGMLVDKRFAQDDSHEAVKAFVREAEDEFAGAEPGIKALSVELLVRSALGEDELFSEVPPDEALGLMPALSTKMVDDLEYGNDQIDQLLNDAEDVAAR